RASSSFSLGTRLMQRTTRRHSLTEAGSAFYPRAVQILQLVDEAEQDLALETDAVRGRLRLSAPVSFAIRHLAPALTDFKRAYPAVMLDVTFNDHLVNLVEEGVDLAVRITSSWWGGLLGECRGGLVSLATRLRSISRSRPLSTLRHQRRRVELKHETDHKIR
ncbi:MULTISPECIES: LysR family transcriptional regulator, partial [unclassified Ectothiorhodospira]|uniref:LysR family transcriptional regulator n=1 Tax=unclassified Ectothiorhodospira TaxID=2684909 RepID=UPI001EE7FC1A